MPINYLCLGVLFLYPKHFHPKAIPFGPVIIKLRFTQPDFVFTLIHWELCDEGRNWGREPTGSPHIPARVGWSVQ